MLSEGEVMRKRTTLLIIFCISAGFFAAVYLIGPRFLGARKQIPTLIPMAVNQLADIDRAMQKLILEEVLVKEIKQKQELITMEVELTEEIVWDDTWGQVELFKKSQKVHFTAKGLYVTDLHLLQPEHIQVDRDMPTMTLYIPRPYVKTITIEEEKTKFEAVQKGWLRFGEIKLTPSQQQIMAQQVKSKMTEKMQGNSMYEDALKNTKRSVQSLLETILQGQGTHAYEVHIEFQKEVQDEEKPH